MTVLYRNISVPFDRTHEALPGIVARHLNVPRAVIRELRIAKKSLDSRGRRKPRHLYTLILELDPFDLLID